MGGVCLPQSPAATTTHTPTHPRSLSSLAPSSLIPPSLSLLPLSSLAPSLLTSSLLPLHCGGGCFLGVSGGVGGGGTAAPSAAGRSVGTKFPNPNAEAGTSCHLCSQWRRENQYLLGSCKTPKANPESSGGGGGCRRGEPDEEEKKSPSSAGKLRLSITLMQ